ncbi:centriole proteome [Chlorella sorokiniana]|uniref:Centriole proteome n=1 Tax=Chlorella sorokiniana TaxID=3076 RepID=A0A2P6TUX5_CHLSO|nr:centriole proteome [Chlorella sorokiniana]|eukprot:PRW57851.1 centriole proteome [Chlorella sorokiniana]
MRPSAAQQLEEVEAVRQARLEAATCRYQLEQAHGELAELRQQVAALAQVQGGRDVGAGAAAAWEEALQAARLEAADSKYKLQLTELELAKQLDALQELQWQLECVVCQLGLAPPGGSAAPGAGQAVAGSAAAGFDNPSAPAPAIDHMLLLGKVEELRSAQVQLAECQQRLVQAEAALTAAEARGAAGQQAPAGVAVPDAAAHPAGDGSMPLGAGGQELVSCLLGENKQLRARLADAEAGEGCGAAGNSSPRRGKAPAGTSEPADRIARQRLQLQLEQKDAQLGKLRGVVRELEGKLIDAYKRQADLVMRDSSWREQEAQDRRLAALDEERARLAFAAQAAQAEAEAARRETAVQRRLVARLQQAAAEARESVGAAGGGSAQVVDLLQKRVKVLEAQNIKLRLQARASKEEEQLATAEAAAAAAATRRAQRGRGGAAGGAAGGAIEEGGEEEAGGEAAAGENDSPNRAEGGGNGSGGGAGSLLDGNPVLERWAADKRLQKRVEALQAKLRDKTTVLVSAQAGRSRAEEQAQAVRSQLEQCQAALQRVQAQLRAAEQRAAPGTMVPVEQHQQALYQLDELQQRLDGLERQHAALQRQVQGAVASPGSPNAAQGEPSVCGSPEVPGTSRPTTAAGAAVVPRSISAPVAGGGSLRASRAYCPGAYGGAAWGKGDRGMGDQIAQLQGQLLAKDVQLLDAQLQRDQAAAEAERQRRRLQGLLECLSPHPHDAAAADAIAEARQLAGLPDPDEGAAAEGGSGRSGAASGAPAAGGGAGRPAGKGAGAGGSGAGGSRRRGPSGREQELVDTIALLKNALERTKKGLESGVSSSKYRAAVDRAKQLKAKCAEQEAALADATKAREELARVQAQLGALHGTCSALKSQLRAAREQREEAGSAREHLLAAQVSELERTLQERDAQMEALNASLGQVDEEVRVLVAEGLRPADLIQELLLLRPRLRELESRNAELSEQLAALERQCAVELQALTGEHELLRQQCGRWEGEVRRLCSLAGEPLPRGLAALVEPA